MRIGIVLPHLIDGGAERATLRLADGLIERGHSVDLILLRPTGNYCKDIPRGAQLFHTTYPLRRVTGARAFLSRAAQNDLPPEKLPVSPWRRYCSLWMLRGQWPEGRITSRDALNGAGVAAYILRIRPDVLFAALHQANIAAVCGKALASANTPLAISLRNNLAFDYSENALVRARTLYHKADAVIAVSKGVAEGAAQLLGFAPNRIIAIHNPVPLAVIATAAAEPVKHPWFAEDKIPVVLTVGRATYQKDHSTLVRALALLRRSTEVRLAIFCNSGGFKASSGIRETQTLAASLGVAEHVAHFDFDENPFRYMARAKAVTLSSRYEGFPNVLLEAMACGTPVVSTNAPYGPAEILEGGRWGPLVPVGDANALAKELASLLAGHRISAADLQARAADFSTEKAVDAYESLFIDISS